MSSQEQLPDGRDRLTELLARIDERTSRLIEDVSELRRNVVTKVEFESRFRPVQLISFGLVAGRAAGMTYHSLHVPDRLPTTMYVPLRVRETPALKRTSGS